VLTALLALASVTATPGTSPWFADPGCVAALRSAVEGSDAEALVARTALARRGDLAGLACSVWLELPRDEVELALEGPNDALNERRTKRLGRLFGFSKRFGRQDPSFAALELEARMRRVRLLVDIGDRTEGLAEARRVQKMLAAARKDTQHPSVVYVAGVIDLAVSSANLPLRLLLGMAGIEGDVDRGRRGLESLVDGDTVYAADALFLLAHFERAREGLGTPRALVYAERLSKRYPSNPQFAFDHAEDLIAAGRAKEVGPLLAPFRARLDASPEAWSPLVRAKLHWALGHAAFASGDRPGAAERLRLARSQAVPAMGDRLEDLAERLGDAG
jgi:hypothetical protein